MEARQARRLARILVEGAAQCGVILRAFGGAAVALLTRDAPRDKLFRSHTDDLDFVAPFSQADLWTDALAAMGFRETSSTTGLMTRRCEYVGTADGVEIDVQLYSAPLKFPDVMPGPYFCARWPLTIPPTTLLLSKLLVGRTDDHQDQIRDIAALLHQAQGTSGFIDPRKIAYALRHGMDGWRRWQVATARLTAVETHLSSVVEAEPATLETVRSALVHLRHEIMAVSPDLAWRIADMLGRAGLAIGATGRVEPGPEPFPRSMQHAD